MKLKYVSILTAVLFSFVMLLGIGGTVNAQTEAEDVELALVDSAEVHEVDPEFVYEDIQEITEDLGYDLAVDTLLVDWYINEEIDVVTDFISEDVTEEVDEIIGDSESIDEVEEMDGVEDITDEVLEEISE
ncbi:MAG: hypothetical protein ACOC21_02845 [Halanaerobiales bacterium]